MGLLDKLLGGHHGNRHGGRRHHGERDTYYGPSPASTAQPSAGRACTSCGRINSGDSRYCSECGKPFVVSTACPQCSAILAPDA